jgi:hypothetical protein
MKRLSLGLAAALLTIHVAAQPQTQPPPLRLSLQGKPWAFQVVAPGFVVTQNTTQADGRRYLMAAKEPHLVLSVTLEQVTETPAWRDAERYFVGEFNRMDPSS